MNTRIIMSYEQLLKEVNEHPLSKIIKQKTRNKNVRKIGRYLKDEIVENLNERRFSLCGKMFEVRFSYHNIYIETYHSKARIIKCFSNVERTDYEALKKLFQELSEYYNISVVEENKGIAEEKFQIQIKE